MTTKKNITHPPQSEGQATDRVRSLQLTDKERMKAGGGSMGRWLMLFGLAALVGGGFWASQQYATFQLYAGDGIPECQVVPVAVEIPQETVLDLSGYIVPKRIINISPRIPGTITELHIEEGQEVKAGDLLAKIDDATYLADYELMQAALQLAETRLEELTNGSLEEEIAQAQAAVDQAEAHLELARKEYERSQKLRGTISPADLDRTKANVDESDANLRSLKQKLALVIKGPRAERIKASEAEVKQARANLEKGKYFFDNTRLYAPIDGTILEKKTEIGEILRPEVLMTSLCLLADLNNMEVEVDIQERDLHRIKIGQTCEVVTDAFRDKVYNAYVGRRQPLVSRQRGVVKFTIIVSNPDSDLLPDMNCRVKFLAEKPKLTEPGLWIPKTALVEVGSDTVVFIADGDQARKRSVQLGTKTGISAQVVKGLEAGELVLVPGDEPLTDGQTVRTRLQ